MDFSSIPSVDRVLGDPAVATLLAAHGHSRVTAAIREQLEGIRESLRSGEECPADMATVVAGVASLITNDDADAFKTLLNLTGTVLHTNLGRALLPPSAIEAVARVAGSNSNLEFDLENGRRGDRDDHIEALIQRITGAEAATVVNNNAAAVMLALNALAFDREVPVSRGELVEIGGSFRIPDIMARSGTRLVEVGATNRTHLADYENAIREETVLLLKVHTSNYEITGFTKSVTEAELAELGRKHNLPLMTDLGSGTLINLEQFGLPHETTVQDMIEAGADVVTFSGDKLLGGPQAGIIAGRKDLIARIKSNPMKRAMRVDKMTLAALQAVLKLYLTPEKLVSDVPTIRQLARSQQDIRALAESVLAAARQALPGFSVVVEDVPSQIGSGALPTNEIPSAGLVLRPDDGRDSTLTTLVASMRNLSTPVIGRVHDGSLVLDCRTLEDEALLRSLLQEVSGHG